jgi:hypothetical protein
MTSPVSYTNLTDVFYAATSGYPIDWSRGRNRCMLRLPAAASVLLTLLDARARAINSAQDCAYRLLVTGDRGNGTIVFGQWCARMNWTQTTVQVPDTGSRGLLLGVAFDPAPSAAGNTVEGKLWIMMAGNYCLLITFPSAEHQF